MRNRSFIEYADLMASYYQGCQYKPKGYNFMVKKELMKVI